MSHMVLQSLRSGSSSPSNESQLSCGGEACEKCGACRDWYQQHNSHDVIKRYNASCTLDHMFRHKLVRHPVRSNQGYHPVHALICMCRENGW
ncbi:unnamed protein product [Adineta ricciae]|uniref:Uncharacterized protein n=1 Tax=Adineta ricciae TaxID=249248 RepID=A0A814VQH9_ADIRI|nr:unnamed protein product [Adineta ricciae]CAF1252488.1 unnamed protein product [Adineta ricciae]